MVDSGSERLTVPPAKPTLTRWHSGFLALVAAKIACGAVLGLIGLFLAESPLSTRIPFFLAILAAYTAGAALLILGGPGVAQAQALGTVFLLAASPYSEAAIGATAGVWAPAAWLDFLWYVQIDALLPFFLWRFAHFFPVETELGSARTFVRVLTRVSLVVGVALLVVNAAMFFGTWLPALDESGPLGLVRRRNQGSYYWTIVFVLQLLALGFLLWKTRRALTPARNRALVFIGALLLGFAPLFLVTIGEVFSPTIEGLFSQPRSSFITLLIMDSFLITVPFTTAYAVLVHRVIDMRSALRKALQYTFARYSLIAAGLLPLVSIAVLLYRNREQTVRELVTGPPVIGLMVLSAFAMSTLRFRKRWFDSLDRRFFREIYDARQILSNLIESTRAAPDLGTLAAVLGREIDRALHVERVSVFFLQTDSDELVESKGHSRLSLEWRLLRLLDGGASSIHVDPERLSEQFLHLPDEELGWILDSGFRLLVAMRGSDSLMVGLLALGEKLSELPFSREDTLLLEAVAASASIAVEQRRLELAAVDAWPGGEGRSAQTTLVPGDSGDAAAAGRVLQLVAMECVSCGKIARGSAPTCESCGLTTRALAIPSLLHGKFELRRRIGAGGMGVVYLGIDVALGREVALKTLPRISRVEAARLRREARAFARVSHPNLAMIYGVETWRGVPILVLEYLELGSLTSRLRDGPLSLDAALELGLAMVDALDCLHQAGMLHRDIKPSNVGFARGGVPKLLDFGLAKLVENSGAAGAQAMDLTASVEPAALLALETTTITRSRGGRRVIGTPLYMSPEALKGEEPSFGFDLWSASVVLFEAMTGRHPFRASDMPQTLTRIARGKAAGVEELIPGCPRELPDFFASALSPRPAQRPKRAAELRAAMLDLREAIRRRRVEAPLEAAS